MKTIAAVLFGGFIIAWYLAFGMTKEETEYTLKGWFFAPARGLKKFLCGMFLGHNWITKESKCFCSYCLKDKKRDL